MMMLPKSHSNGDLETVSNNEQSNQIVAQKARLSMRTKSPLLQKLLMLKNPAISEANTSHEKGSSWKNKSSVTSPKNDSLGGTSFMNKFNSSRSRVSKDSIVTTSQGKLIACNSIE